MTKRATAKHPKEERLIFLFLKEDLDQLDRHIQELQERLKDINHMKGQSTTQSSET